MRAEHKLTSGNGEGARCDRNHKFLIVHRQQYFFFSNACKYKIMSRPAPLGHDWRLNKVQTEKNEYQMSLYLQRRQISSKTYSFKVRIVFLRRAAQLCFLYFPSGECDDTVLFSGLKTGAFEEHFDSIWLSPAVSHSLLRRGPRRDVCATFWTLQTFHFSQTEGLHPVRSGGNSMRPSISSLEPL